MATQVRITTAVQGARHTPITVDWGINLTSATITGTKQLLGDDTVYVLDGSFAIPAPATDGIFVWTLGAGDVGTPGRWLVQFKATFASDYDMTCEGNWLVYVNQGAGLVPSGALVGVTESQAAFLDDINITAPVDDGQVLTWDATAGEWINEDAAAGGLANIVEDTTPELGGNLSLNGFTITGLAIGTDVQAYDAGLSDIAALAVTDGNIIVGNGANWIAESGATARTSLGAAAASDLTTHTGSSTSVHGIADTSALLDSGDIGSTVQAYDADLTAIAALTHADGNFIVSDGAAWVVESGATVRASLGLGTLATQSGTFSGNGTLATGGFALTVPATGTAALLGAAQTFTAANIFTGGISAPATGANTQVFGTGHSVGSLANVTAFGTAITASDVTATAFGRSITVGKFGVAVGNATTAGENGVSIGYNITNNSVNSMALGNTVTVTAPNQLVLNLGGGIQNTYFNGVTAAIPVATAINVCGGAGTNIAGASLTIAGGRGTGTGAGGSLLLATAPVGASGSSLNALVTAVEIDDQATGGDETRVLILDLSGTPSLKRISFDADDSGGLGFKTLRVPN